MSESTSRKGFPEQPSDFFQDIIAQKPPHEHLQFQTNGRRRLPTIRKAEASEYLHDISSLSPDDWRG